MNKGAKIAIWIIGGLVTLLVLAVVGLKLFFPVETVRAMAVEKASATLGRPVSIGKADLSLWGGIGVKMSNVSVGNPTGFAGDPFVSARSIDVKVAFWPLLSRKVQVTRLIVESPVIAMHKLPNGISNYAFASAESAASGTAGIPDEVKPAAAAIAFDNLEVHNGRLLFVDDSSNRHISAAGLSLATTMDNPSSGLHQTRGKLQVDTLIVSSMQKLPPVALTVDYNAAYDMGQKLLTIEDIQLAVNGVVIGLSGKVSNQTGSTLADLHVKSDRINTADLFKLLPADKLTALADFTVNGTLSFDAQVIYDSAKTPVLNYSGVATVSGLTATRKGIDGELKIAKMPVEFAVDRVKLGIEGGQFASQPFSGSCSAEDFADPSVNGAIKGNFDLAFLQPFLPQKGHPQLKGKTTVDLAFAGRPREPASISVTGNLAVTEASLYDSLLPEPITHLDADMSLKRDTIAIKSMNVKFVSSDASFAGTLSKPFPYLLPMKKLDRTKLQKPFFQFTLKSHRFDSDKLFPEAVPGSGENRASKPVDSLPPILVPDIDGQGTCAIDTLVYSKVEITGIAGKIRIKDRKVEVYDATGKVYTGSVAGNTTVDLNDFNNPKYTGQFTATQIEADDFIRRFSKMGGFLYGKLDLKGDYNAIGWEPNQFLSSLTLSSLGAVQDGKLVTSGVAYDLLNNIAQKLGQPFDKEQPLKGLTSNIMVKDGKVMVDGLKTKLLNIGDLKLGGYYGFNNQIGYDGTIELTKELTAKLTSQGGLLGGLAGLLTNKQSERLLIPLKVTGTLDKPNAEIDFNALTKGATINVKKGAGGFLENLIKKK
jgi:hypothetical protein